MSTQQSRPEPFDFDNHRRMAVESYEKVRNLYAEFADVTKAILNKALTSRDIKVASIEARAKSITSFADKAATPSPSNPNLPKYANPMAEITDLAGVRIITFLPRTIAEVDRTIYEELVVIERSDKGDLLREEEFGYQSIHYLIKLRENRASLPEYQKFKELVAEIQVRTILQHAWAEIEHDIGYKSVETIPTSIRRRFASLAGLLEIADNEFEAIQDEDQQLKQKARKSVEEGRLDVVELTPDALKAYLDKKLGPDRRMALDSYDWLARWLRSIGFNDLRQINECIEGYDDQETSRIAEGYRGGQLTRFEAQLIAGLGDYYVVSHPFNKYKWWSDSANERLKRLRAAGVKVGRYRPSVEKNS